MNRTRTYISFVILFSAGLLLAGKPARGEEIFAKPTIESLQKRIAALPTEGRSRAKAQLKSDLATLLYEQGQFEEGARYFEESLTHRCNKKLKRHNYLYLGKCYEAFERTDKAISAYELALQYDRKNWKRYRDLAVLYEKVILYQNAVDTYKGALKYNAKEDSVYFDLGRTYRKMGLLERAEENFEKAQDWGADKAAVSEEFSYVYEGQGRFEAAATVYAGSLGAQATPANWARVVYLASLAKDKKLANEGLNNLRKVETLTATVPFYEEMVELVEKAPDQILSLDITDPALKALVKSIR